MIQNEYMFNRRFREYVDKYCQDNECTVEEAFTHEAVRKAYLHFTET